MFSPRVLHSWGRSNVLYVGTTFTTVGEYRHEVPAISSRRLYDLDFAEYSFTKQSMLHIDVKYRDHFLVKYVYGFNASDFAYFVVVQKKSHLPGRLFFLLHIPTMSYYICSPSNLVLHGFLLTFIYSCHQLFALVLTLGLVLLSWTEFLTDAFHIFGPCRRGRVGSRDAFGAHLHHGRQLRLVHGGDAAVWRRRRRPGLLLAHSGKKKQKRTDQTNSVEPGKRNAMFSFLE